MAWDVRFADGIWLPQVEWWLDARLPVERSFVSHAHFDHLADHRELICTRATALLMRSRLPGTRVEHLLAFGQEEPLTADCTITLHPAGHICGSAQALLAHAVHGRLLYTGDFKLRPGQSAEPCATPPADLLIMETTFGRPHYVFPPTAQVLDDIQRFCREVLRDGDTPVLFGYSLGKSQELLSSLAAARLPVMLHPATFRLTRIYEEIGLSFPPYREFSATELAGHVVICPQQPPGSAFLTQIPRRRTAMLTGWAIDAGTLYRSQCDAAFPLSDHADFPDLLKFVELVNPRRVLTVHGFATDFARTLRDRGIEAWALGQSNQLDLEISPLERSFVPAVPLERSVAAEPATPSAFARFAGVADAIRRTASKLEKSGAVAEYLKALPEAAAAQAATFFSGRPFPQSDARNLNLGWAAVKRAVLEVSQKSEADLRAAYRKFADSGEAAGEMLVGRTEPRANELAEVGAFFAEVAAARGPVAKLELLTGFLRRLSPGEAKYLVKIMSGDLRIGLKEGLLEEAIALAAGQPAAAVREANMLSGDMAAVTAAAMRGTLEELQLRVFHPLQFMLASPEPTAEAILERLSAPVWLEEKYDGIRCQVHKREGRVELYSRELHRITEQFPDLARAAQSLPGDFIGDGELLAWRDGRALPFGELQKRLGRKGDDFFLGEEIPVSLSLFDLLWRDGRALLKEPLRMRRELLAAMLAHPPPGVRLAPVRQAGTIEEIETAFADARHRGNEGLIAKDPASPYTPGRRGLAWLKLKKAFATLDVVVVAVELGHGKRRNVLSDYTFAVKDSGSDRLLTVGKAYSGLTDVEIADLTQHFLENTLEERGRRRTVVPNVVLEVAFDSIQRSDRHDGGYALRFPRIHRIRKDKTVGDIDTIETCRRLAGNHAFAEAGDGQQASRAFNPDQIS